MAGGALVIVIEGTRGEDVPGVALYTRSQVRQH